MNPVDPRVAELENLLAAALDQIRLLSARVAELERRLGERGGGGGGPAGGKAETTTPREPSERKRGGQPGHKGHRRELLEPEKVTRTVECFPEECRKCGEALPKKPDDSPVLHQVIDLRVMRDVTEYRKHRVTCHCGETTCGSLPAGAPAGVLGTRLLALVALLTAACHVSRRKVQLLLSDVLDIHISLGALSESEEVVSDAVDGPVEDARLHAIAARVKYADGTTWYRAHIFRALWTLGTSAVTVFGIFASGSKDALKAWMGQSGTLVSDRGSQLVFWAMRRRQICWAHLLRKFAWYAQQRGDAGQLGATLLVYTRSVLREWRRVRDGCITRATFARNTSTQRLLIEALLETGARQEPIAGSCKHILKHREALWRFATTDGVEPTNNHAEQEIRGFVLWRKTTLGSQSERGDRFAANLKSVIHTCRKQQRHVWTYLVEAIQASLSNRSPPSLLSDAP